MPTMTLAKGVLVALLMLVAPATVWGHEHHEHHLMGTVTAVDASHLELTTTEDKAVSVAITPETKVLKSKTLVGVAEIKKGARVMIQTDGATTEPKAVSIDLGADK
jgi:hypothetical protein